MQRKRKNAVPVGAALPMGEVAKELLEPILRFLSASGMTQSVAKKAFDHAWQSVARKRPAVRINRLSSLETYGELIGAWTSLPGYLDQHGNPRDLTMRGPKGFNSLVMFVDKKLPSHAAISVLQIYGNVARLRNGRFRLLTPFFHVNNKSALAFEPSARFIADASSTVNRLVHPGSKRSTPKLFWRAAGIRDLPKECIDSYLDFARRRSLVFLQEIDDWLQSHGDLPTTSSKRVRAGLGVFSICGAPAK